MLKLVALFLWYILNCETSVRHDSILPVSFFCLFEENFAGSHILASEVIFSYEIVIVITPLTSNQNFSKSQEDLGTRY